MAACPVCGATNARGARFCSTCGTALTGADPGARRETRKTVTVLFADVAGSTALGEALDPESLRAVMTRYFADMKAIIEGHGGQVEKFIGDAVMAVFGMPVTHEDDALRAVRAAADIRDRLVVLNAELERTRGNAIRFRTGVNTGEVVAGSLDTADSFVTGDTVNTAARLEQNAPPGEVLLGAPTYRLVRDAVEVEPVEPIAAKGKAEPVTAYRLLTVTPDAAGHARHLDRPLVGRERELGLLRAEFEQALSERSVRLVTVLGTAGVGKSRLVAELVELVAAEAQLLKGRCLPYGEGITYWPIRELVTAAAGIVEADTADAARVKIRDVLSGEQEAELLAGRVGTALGLETEPAPQEELFWAIRKLLEHLARARPTVLVIEDIHWAEPTLLDLFEYIIDLAADAPLLIVCPARPELLESRPGWAGRSGSSLLRLEPLGEDATERLIEETPGGRALPTGLRSRILAAAEGNPLFVEELLSMLVDEHRLVEVDSTWQAASDLDALAIPASIKALLAARIDGLPEAERQVAERASVVGRTFEAAAVRELAGDGATDVGRNLLALVRKELVRPDRSELVAGDAFKFRHILIRDAAYEALPKAERAVLHERFADWLVRVTGDRAAEYDEITGHHYAEAHRYRTELGETGEHVERLAERAAERLLAAGERASDQEAVPAAIALLRRAVEVSPGGPRAGHAGFKLAAALFLAGRFDEAKDVGDAAVRAARAASDDVARVNAELTLLGVRQARGEISQVALIRQVQAARGIFTQHHDKRGLRRVEMIWSVQQSLAGSEALSIEAARRAMEHSRALGDVAGAAKAISYIADSYLYGSTEAKSAVEELDRELDGTRANAGAFYLTAGALAALRAMLADFDVAGSLLEERQRVARDRGSSRDLSNRAIDGIVALLRNDARAAVEAVAEEYAARRDRGDRITTGFHGFALAEALLKLGDLSAARNIVRELEEIVLPDDVGDRAELLLVQARLDAASDSPRDAVAKATQTIELLEPTDWLDRQARSREALGEALMVAGDGDAAAAAFHEAMALFERKGSVVGRARVAETLRRLRMPAR